jgi:TonB family protein
MAFAVHMGWRPMKALLAVVLLACATSVFAQPPKPSAASAKPSQPAAASAGSGYVGDDTCVACHDNKEKQLKTTLHGKPQNVRTVRGVGNGLDQKAVDAVKQYRFKPAMLDGKPKAESLNVEVNFQFF